MSTYIRAYNDMSDLVQNCVLERCCILLESKDRLGELNETCSWIGIASATRQSLAESNFDPKECFSIFGESVLHFLEESHRLSF